MLEQSKIIPDPKDVGALGNRINLATRDNHISINTLINFQIIFALRRPKLYLQVLKSFYNIFKTVEKIWQDEKEKNTRIGKILKQVWNPAIARSKALELDIKYFESVIKNQKEKYLEKKIIEKDIFSSPKLLPKQKIYVEHIKKVCNEKPHLILAYAHVIYLALFAGGQIMHSTIAKSKYLFPMEHYTFEYDNEENIISSVLNKKTLAEHKQDIISGTHFFCFDDFDPLDLRAIYKQNYEISTRNNLTEEEKLEIISESVNVFNLSQSIITELIKINQKKMLKKAWPLVLLLFVLFIYLLIRFLTKHSLHIYK